MGPPDEGNGPAPLDKGAGPNEAAAAKLPLSTNEVTGPHRQDQREPRGPLADLGRAVTDGDGPAGDRLRAAADTAAAMVAAGQIDCTDAVAAVWIAAQGAGIGGGQALAAIAAAFAWADRGPS